MHQIQNSYISKDERPHVASCSCTAQCWPGGFVKTQIEEKKRKKAQIAVLAPWISDWTNWGGAWECAFLTSSLVMLMQLDWGHSLRTMCVEWAQTQLPNRIFSLRNTSPHPSPWRKYGKTNRVLRLSGHKNSSSNSTNSHMQTPGAFGEGEKASEVISHLTIFHLAQKAPPVCCCCSFNKEKTEAQKGSMVLPKV